MSEQTAEERRAELIRWMGLVIQGVFVPDPTARAIPQFPIYAMAAEAVLNALESGQMGVHIVSGGDLQGSVGIVIDQLRVARAEVERLSAARYGPLYVRAVPPAIAGFFGAGQWMATCSACSTTWLATDEASATGWADRHTCPREETIDA